MSYQRLIHEYLDEGLESPREDILFAELNINPDMRNEFNQQVRLHVITQNDMGTISPPVEATNMIFSTLGFTLPSSDQAPAAIKSGHKTGAAFSAAWNKYLSTITTALITAVITTLVVLNMQEKPLPAANSDANPSNNGVPLVGSYESPHGAVPNEGINNGNSANSGSTDASFASGNNNNNNNTVNGNVGRRRLIVTPSVSETASQEDKDINDNENDFTDNYISRAKISENINFGNINSGLTTAIPVPLTLNPAGILLPVNSNGLEFLNGWHLELRSLPTQEYSVKPSSGALFQDIGLGVSYNWDEVDDGLYLGLEFGQEAIPMNFTRQSVDGQLRTYSPNPVLFWGGASLKYELNGLFGFNPYASGTLAYLNAGSGLLGRIGLGFSYELYSGWKINGGYEFVYFPYKVDGVNYETTKSGWTLGVQTDLGILP